MLIYTVYKEFVQVNRTQSSDDEQMAWMDILFLIPEMAYKWPTGT